MKRIAALAATALVTAGLGLLAGPGTAVASTIPTYKPPPVAVGCRLPVPRAKLRPPVSPKQALCCAAIEARVIRAREIKPRGIKVRPIKGHRVTIVAWSGFCAARPLTFDLPAWSSTVTEVHGPRLYVREAVFYRGQIYTVASVSGDTFTVDRHGSLFTNGGTAIVDGHALVLGRPLVVIFVGPPPKR
jgi:hypothetical protein